MIWSNKAAAIQQLISYAIRVNIGFEAINQTSPNMLVYYKRKPILKFGQIAFHMIRMPSVKSNTSKQQK